MAIRQLAYGNAPNLIGKYLHMGEQTSYDCLNNFCKCVFTYVAVYLRQPNAQDVQRLISKHQELHGFLGMLGSLVYIHWAWKTCPTIWQIHYTRGDKSYPSIKLEDVASFELWIWHDFFGPMRSNNGVDVLSISDLFDDLKQDRAPPCIFTVYGCNFNKGYYLGDGLHPDWAIIVKSFKFETRPKSLRIKKCQRSARKDIERAFGVL
ncbi:uncharacterized protein [Rutidosis leptorrhynchoides]|uniref:uncharacterized protein n=1 Tax=Rutidosis leptorrhynchoides TaxID=125765 RepID=UPI003A99D663